MKNATFHYVHASYNRDELSSMNSYKETQNLKYFKSNNKYFLKISKNFPLHLYTSVHSFQPISMTLWSQKKKNEVYDERFISEKKIKM